MKRRAFSFLAMVSFGLTIIAHGQVVPSSINLRYSAQLSNASAGNCGCFSLQGGAVDAYWRFSSGIGAWDEIGVAIDIGSEHTSNVNGAPYGLTLTTVTAGPRVRWPLGRVSPFAQGLIGFAHGSGSAFPSDNTLASSANSFALDLGGGADLSVDRRLSVRLPQVDYLRTSLPNNSSNWQNNLRVAAGITIQFSR